MQKTQIPTLKRVSELRDELRVLVDENLKPNKKTVYDSRINNFRDELDEIGISKDLTLREAERALEKWYELLNNPQIDEIPAPEYSDPNLTKTTWDKEESKQFVEEAEKKAEQQAEIKEKSKREVEQGLKTKQKIYDLEQQKQKDKQVDNLLTQLFKSKKVIVVPAEEIPTTEKSLSNSEKESLIATVKSAKEDPLTTMEVFQEKIEKSIENAPKEVQAVMTKPVIQLSAIKLVEDLKSLPDYKTVDEIPERPKTLNTLSIFNPLIDPNSKELKKLIPNEEARIKFVSNLQSEMLALDSERAVKIATTKAVLGSETIAYALYGNETLTNFKISEDPRDKEKGVEFDPIKVYKQAKEFRNIFQKIRGVKTAEEVATTSLTYYPTYTYSGVGVATKTVSTLTKALPVVGAVYGFKQGTLLSQWAKSGTPLLSAGNQHLVRLLTTNAGVQEIASASLVTFSKPLIAFEGGGLKVLLVTGTNQSLGTQIAVGGVQFGGKMAGAIAVKGGTQVAVVTGTQAGASLAIGTSTVLTKVLTFIGGLGSWATAGLSLVGGYVVGKVVEAGVSKFKVWWTKNKDKVAPMVAFVVAIPMVRFLGPTAGILGGVGTFALLGGSVAGLAYGTWRFFGILGRNVGITITTPVIVTLLVLPPLVAFIMLVINNGAYVVPPGLKSLGIGVSNPYLQITKVANPDKLDNPTSSTNQVTYTVTITALKENLTDVKITETKCTVTKKSASTIQNCPDELEDIPELSPGLSISPTNSYSFTFTSSFDSSYSDSTIFDSITISAKNEKGDEITSIGSESVCVGDCPHGCFEISDENEAWPANFSGTLEGAIGELISKFPGFVDQACNGRQSVKLCYTTKNPSPMGTGGLCNSAIYGITSQVLDGENRCVVNFNQCGLDGDQKDAFFLLTHELSHHIQWRDGGNMINKYENAGGPSELPLCTYSGTNGNNYEGSAEANALYATGGVASFSTCSTNFQSQYPRNYNYSKDYMSNP
jgi:hypothetical protein